jgi:hypothetical protein
MNARHWRIIGLTALAATLLVPGTADAQLGRIDVGIDLGRDRGFVTYNDGRLAVGYARGFGRLDLVDFIPVNGVRVPRGFRPAPGYCRLWIPGLPPGHQPSPVRCAALNGGFGNGVLLVTPRGVLRPVWDRSVRRYWRDYRDARIIRPDPRGRYWYDRDDFWWDDRYDDWDDWDDRYDSWDDRYDRWDDRRDRERDRAERRWDRGRDRAERVREQRQERAERARERREDRRDRSRGRGNR